MNELKDPARMSDEELKLEWDNIDLDHENCARTDALALELETREAAL